MMTNHGVLGRCPIIFTGFGMFSHNVRTKPNKFIRVACADRGSGDLKGQDFQLMDIQSGSPWHRTLCGSGFAQLYRQFLDGCSM